MHPNFGNYHHGDRSRVAWAFGVQQRRQRALPSRTCGVVGIPKPKQFNRSGLNNRNAVLLGLLAIAASTAVYTAAESLHWSTSIGMPRGEIIIAVMGNVWHAVILARAAIELAIEAVMESFCRVVTLATAAIQMATKAVMESFWCVVILAIAAVKKAINAVMESLCGVAMLARATIEKAVRAVMERVRHIKKTSEPPSCSN